MIRQNEAMDSRLIGVTGILTLNFNHRFGRCRRFKRMNGCRHPMVDLPRTRIQHYVRCHILAALPRLVFLKKIKDGR